MQPNEHITHDFTEVQRHMEQMQGPHRMRLLMGHGIRTAAIILALGIAVPLSSIGVGFGIQLGQEQQVGPSGPEGPPGPKGERGLTGPRGAAGNDASPTEEPKFPVTPPVTWKVARNYVIFNSQQALIDGKTYSVHVGHNYVTSTQDTYDDAFCYAMAEVRGIAARLELSQKSSPNELPKPEFDRSATAIGLTSADLTALRGKCSYL
jgi:hypothetical protein